MLACARRHFPAPRPLPISAEPLHLALKASSNPTTHEKDPRADMAKAPQLLLWRDVMADAVRAENPDLSMRQWAILLTVYLHPGPHTVRALARELNVPKPAISRALDALSILGLVRRVRNEQDRRIVNVQRTPEGSVFIDDFTQLVNQRSSDPVMSAALYA